MRTLISNGMWRTTWKGMWSHKRRLLGTMTAVLLGVAFLAAALTTGDTMTAGFDSLFREANSGTDVVVRNATRIGTADTQVRGSVDTDLADDLAAIDGVASVATVIEGSGRIVGADGEPIGGDGPPTVATNWLGDSPLNPWTLAAGDAPRDVATNSPYEVVIDRSSAELAGLEIGDETNILTPEPTPVVVVGIATIGGVDSLGPTTFSAFTEQAVIDLVGRPGEASEIRLAAVDGVSEEALRATVTPVTPSGAEAITGAELTDELLADIEGDFLGMFKYVLLAFAGIALVVASFSINNTFSILIAQRGRESALLRALGASRRQVLTSVIIEALAIGAAASVVGIAAGYGLAVGLKELMDRSGLDLGFDGVVMSTSTVIIALAIGIGSTLLASLLPAVRASRVAPLAALRDTAVDTSGTSRRRLVVGAGLTAAGVATVVASTASSSALLLAGIGSLATLVGAVALGPVAARPAAAVIGLLPRALRGQTGRLARRNAMRDPRRTAASASALMVGTAVVALFTTFGASIKATIGDVVDQDFGGDLIVVSDDFSGAGLSPEVAAGVAALDEVELATGMGTAVMLADGATIDPAVADAGALNSLLDLDVSGGEIDAVGPGTIAISDGYAERNDIHLGDPVAAEFADGANADLTVVATYGSTINVGDMIISPDDWIPHATQTGDVVVLIDLSDGVSEAEGLAAVTAITDRLDAPTPQTRSEYIDSIGSEVDQMLFFVYGMLALAILIALMGIANTLSLSIHERTRELGLLRAVGQTRSEVRSTVRWESVIVAIFGTVGGVALGTFLGWGLLRALAAEVGYGTLAVPATSLVVVVVLAALAGIVAAWRPSRRAGRLDILTAIATD